MFYYNPLIRVCMNYPEYVYEFACPAHGNGCWTVKMQLSKYIMWIGIIHKVRNFLKREYGKRWQNLSFS